MHHKPGVVWGEKNHKKDKLSDICQLQKPSTPLCGENCAHSEDKHFFKWNITPGATE